MFSTLYDKVEGAKVLDCFAGTGAFGIEAISRGAESCTFVDTNTAFLMKNLKDVQRNCVRTIKKDFFKTASALGGGYDIVFIDPPYGIYGINKTLEYVKENALLANGGVLIYEESVRTPFEPEEACFELLKEKKYGETIIRYFG